MMQPSTPRYLPDGTENLCSPKDLHMNILREFPSYKQQKCLSPTARMKYFRDIDTEENQSTAKRSKLLIKRRELLGCTKNRFYLCIYVLCMYVCIYVCLSRSCPWHIEVSRPGIELTPQQ